MTTGCDACIECEECVLVTGMPDREATAELEANGLPYAGANHRPPKPELVDELDLI